MVGENNGSVQIYDNVTCSAPSVQGASQTITVGATTHNDITYATDGSDDGVIQFYAIVTDEAGNASICDSISLSYTLDTIVPTVAITVFPDITGANQTNYGFSGTCSENGREVTVSVDGINPAVQPTCTANAWSVSGMDVSAASEGSINILADHTDLAGNNAIQAS